MDFLYSVVGFLIAIGVLVAVHEFGHFWVARKLGVKVLRYSIGFGRPLWKKVHGDDQIEYVVAAIPLGGYVKMLGEGDETPVAEHEKHRAFDRQPIWKRTLIVAAGPGINFLFAILIFMILGSMNNEALEPKLGNVAAESIVAKAGVNSGDKILSIDGRKVDFFGQHDLHVFNQVLRGKDIILSVEQANGDTKTVNLPVKDIPIYNISPSFLTRTLGLVPVFPKATTELDRVLDGTPAATAGLLKGDVITAIDGQAIETWEHLVEVVSTAPGRMLNLDISRGDSKLRIAVTPETVEFDGHEPKGRLGIGPRLQEFSAEQIVAIDRSIVESLVYGVEQTWLMSSVTVRMLWKMLTLQVSHQNVSGPITIASVAGEAIQVGLDYYLHILAVISISLGVMNLLPIPMLDGGHLLMYAVELVAGQNASEKVFAVGQRLGIVFLICLMSLAFYNDIFRLLN